MPVLTLFCKSSDIHGGLSENKKFDYYGSAEIMSAPERRANGFGALTGTRRGE